MNDLIDEWKKDFKGYIDALDIPRDDYNGIMEYIDEVPSVQSEIIQCKDCKFSHMTINGECKYCDIWFPDEKCYMSGDYYCGSAEGREE